MANTYTWTVDRMDCYPTQGSNADVVFAVYWHIEGTDGVNSAGSYSNTKITLDPSDTFVPFPQLTEGQVIGWVHEALGEDGIAQWEGSVDSHLSLLAGPATVTPDLPWAAGATINAGAAPSAPTA